MSFIYSMADTWNAIGTTFNGIYMNISNGAGGAPVGAAASRAFRLDANSTSIFDISITGAVVIAAVGASQSPSLSIGGVANTGFWRNGTGQWTFTSTNGDYITLGNGLGAQFASNVGLSWTNIGGNSTLNTGVLDTFLFRNAAGVVAAGTAAATVGGQLYGQTLRTAQMTIASLPAASTAGAGASLFVTDANLPIIFTTVSAGGAAQIPVYSDGTQWKCG